MIVTLNSDYLTEGNVFDFFIQVKVDFFIQICNKVVKKHLVWYKSM